MPTIAVHLHARVAEIAGVRECVLDVPDGACAGDVKDELARAIPAVAALLDSCAVATDAEYVADDARVGAAGALHVIPPVSGG